MANIVYRLPGREQYSYAEVTFTPDELFGPDALSGDERLELLKTALADLDQVYPKAAAPVGQVAPQNTQPSGTVGPFDCAHGPRKHAKGQSAKGPWQAYFCTHQDKAQQCPAKWLKPGDQGWVY
jgi:hypothetical protein